MMMSILPTLLFSAWWADLNHPHQLMDQNFGLGLHSQDLLLPEFLDRFYPGFREKIASDRYYYRPWAGLLHRQDAGTSTITADKDKFKIILDVQHFKPEEISIKVVDRFVVVEGKHEEKKDEHGTISRHFVRKYYLPEQVDAEQLKSSISDDGILTITAPLKDQPISKTERTIKIDRTGKSHESKDTINPTDNLENATIDNKLEEGQSEFQEETSSN